MREVENMAEGGKYYNCPPPPPLNLAFLPPLLLYIYPLVRLIGAETETLGRRSHPDPTTTPEG